MDITFNCNKCGQNIAIDEAGAGLGVECPKCGQPLEVPHKSKPLPQTKREAPNMDTAKQGSVATKIFVLSIIVVGVAVLISGGLFYTALVKPLRIQVQELTDTVNHNAEALDSLTRTVNHNAETANRATTQLGEALDSLTRTVNHNAETANRATTELGDALDSLTRTVNHNAEIENYNNSLR